MPSAKNSTFRLRSRLITIVLAVRRSFFQAAITSTLESQSDFRILGQATNWRQAVDLVRAHQPEVLITEPSSPHLEAARLLGKLRSTCPVTRTIVLLEFDDSQKAAATRALGVDGVLWKGAVVDDLPSLVRKISEKAASPARRAAEQRLRPVAAPRTTMVPRASLLSKREQEVAALVIAGWKNREIGEKLFISEQTVKNHVHYIFEKLQIRDRLELILRATELASQAISDER
jgi:DNA-binding NarL/FixJ family response regulator